MKGLLNRIARRILRDELGAAAARASLLALAVSIEKRRADERRHAANMYWGELQGLLSRIHSLEPWARAHRQSCPELLAWAQYLEGKGNVNGVDYVHPFDRWGIHPKPETALK